jgi:iron complex outermembrane receptor protein
LLWSILADAEEAPTVLEPVVVTAPVERTPAAETVLPEKQLEAALVETTADLGTRAPDLVVQQGGDRRSNYVQIRGIANTPQATESVGLYVDGIPYADQRASVIPLFDVEAVEVLRGPQNFRFGRSADAGAINVRTRTPGPELGARGSVLFGNFATQIYEASADGPLGSDRVRFSLAGLESRRHGYIENVFLDEPLDDRDLLAGRGKLLLRPLPQLEIALTGEAQHADEGSRALVLLGSPDPFQVAYNTPGSERTDAYLGALRAAYESELVHVTSLTARRSWDTDHSTFDADFSPRNELVLVDDYSFVDWTQEVRLASPDPGARWRWQAGAFFEDTVTRPLLAMASDSTRYIQAPPPAGLGLPFSAPVSDTQQARLHTRVAAGFGELTVALLPRLELTTGLRYQDDRFEIRRGHVFRAPSQHVRLETGAFKAATGSSAWLPQLTLSYRLEAPILLYATVARGYRPGGFAYLVDDLQAARFAPQRDWSWELGAKASWPEWRLSAAATAFYVLSRDFQVPERSGFTSFTVVNADQVTSRGIELSAVAYPARGLEVTTSFGYIDARYDDFRLPGRGPPLDGNRVQLVPPYNFAAAVQYTHTTGVTARIEYQGLGAYDFTEQNTAGQDAYQLLNVRLGWQGTHVGVAVFGQNLTDQTYFSFPIPGGPGGDFIVAPGAPRTFGVVASARF